MRASGRDLVAFWSATGWRDLLRNLGLFAPTALVLTLLEPFDTGDLPLPVRLAYWMLLLGLCALLIGPATALAARLVQSRVGGAWPVLAAGSALVAAPIVGIVHAADLILYRIAVPVLGAQQPPPPPDAFDSGEALFLFGSVLLVTALVVAAASQFVAPRILPPPPAPGARFCSRLPAHLGADLISIRNEDHYLRVTTREGEALILLRLRDAIEELVDYSGLQTHRSWWVATDAVVRAQRKGRRLELLLSNGAKVPVSDRFRPAIEAFLAR